MKYPVLLFFFLLTLLISCKSDKDITEEEISVVDTLASEQQFLNEQLEKIKNWETILPGTYYNAEYFDLIKFNPSPFKAFDEAPIHFGFTMKPKTHFTTSKTKINSFSIHEGGYDILFYIDNGKLKFYYDTDPKNIFEVLEVNETELLAEQEGTGRVISYKKSNSLNESLNEILLVGKYEIVESGRIIEFHKNGTISGWPSFEVFDIPYDFIGLSDFDCLLLSKNKKPKLDDYVLYEATFANPIVTLTKYQADWNNLDHKKTEEVLHLRKRY